jgi:molybdate transport system regulatory protein
MPKLGSSSVSYITALSHTSADKRIDILRLIARGGSISQAGREAGVSYKAAWQAIDTLTNLAGVALVERVVGGAGGGGARITAAGLQLLAAADQMDQARSDVLARLQRVGDSQTVSLSPALTQLSIRTSMRNQLPCRVQALNGKGQIVQVHLRLGEGVELVSRITRESAELLALQPGLAVLALCKATAVTVLRASGTEAQKPQMGQGRNPAANLLSGRATRVSRGETGDEVALTLDAGLQLVGFAQAASGIRSGSRVVARVEESAVVVALPG